MPDWLALLTFISGDSELDCVDGFFCEMQDLGGLNSFCGIYYLHSSMAGRFFTALQVELGFSSSRIGNVLGLMQLVTSFLSPTVSSFADTKKVHRLMVLTQSCLRMLPLAVMWGLYWAGSLSFGLFFVLNSLVSIISTGIGPISDSLVLAALEDKSRYGSVRLWGALSHGVGNLVVGIFIQLFGSFHPMFALSFGTLLPALFTVYRNLPPYASDVKPATDISVSSVVALLTHSQSIKIFFINSVVVGGALALVESLLFVAMVRSMEGSTPILAGLSVFISVLFEIPIFKIAPALINKYGTKTMLIVANVAWILRASGYATFTSAWVVLVLEVFHGVTFGLFYSAGVHICVKQCPPGMDSTMQSLLDMTSHVGAALGTIVGGYLFEWIGTSATFLVFIAMTASATAGIWWWFQEEPEKGQVTAGSTADTIGTSENN